MPLRTCLCCRKVDHKPSLVRFVSVGGMLGADPRGLMPGRGAYVCSMICLEKLYKRGEIFSKALRKKVGLPDIGVFSGVMSQAARVIRAAGTDNFKATKEADI